MQSLSDGFCPLICFEGGYFVRFVLDRELVFEFLAYALHELQHGLGRVRGDARESEG